MIDDRHLFRFWVIPCCAMGTFVYPASGPIRESYLGKPSKPCGIGSQECSYHLNGTEKRSLKGMSMWNRQRRNYITLLLDCHELLWQDSHGMDTWECIRRADGMRSDVTVRYLDGSMVVLQRRSQETCMLIGTDGQAHHCRTDKELLAACRQVIGLCGRGVISVLKHAGEIM